MAITCCVKDCSDGSYWLIKMEIGALWCMWLLSRRKILQLWAAIPVSSSIPSMARYPFPPVTYHLFKINKKLEDRLVGSIAICTFLAFFMFSSYYFLYIFIIIFFIFNFFIISAGLLFSLGSPMPTSNWYSVNLKTNYFIVHRHK